MNVMVCLPSTDPGRKLKPDTDNPCSGQCIQCSSAVGLSEGRPSGPGRSPRAGPRRGVEVVREQVEEETSRQREYLRTGPQRRARCLGYLGAQESSDLHHRTPGTRRTKPAGKPSSLGSLARAFLATLRSIMFLLEAGATQG